MFIWPKTHKYGFDLFPDSRWNIWDSPCRFSYPLLCQTGIYTRNLHLLGRNDHTLIAHSSCMVFSTMPLPKLFAFSSMPRPKVDSIAAWRSLVFFLSWPRLTFSIFLLGPYWHAGTCWFPLDTLFLERLLVCLVLLQRSLSLSCIASHVLFHAIWHRRFENIQ